MSVGLEKGSRSAETVGTRAKNSRAVLILRNGILSSSGIANGIDYELNHGGVQKRPFGSASRHASEPSLPVPHPRLQSRPSAVTTPATAAASLRRPPTRHLSWALQLVRSKAASKACPGAWKASPHRRCCCAGTSCELSPGLRRRRHAARPASNLRSRSVPARRRSQARTWPPQAASWFRTRVSVSLSGTDE